jgi:tripartite-type tricarboxylate transporter receptor subunit TctC
VPFKGSADLMTALLGGHIIDASDSTAWAPHVESGKLRLLVTFGSKRTRRRPEVPTLDELGYKTVSDSPFGLVGPQASWLPLSSARCTTPSASRLMMARCASCSIDSTSP